MSLPIRDPEGVESVHLLRHTLPQGKHVLEIGCGDGRLTRLIAPEAGRMIGSDVTLSKLRVAHNQGSATQSATVRFTAAQAETLPFVTESFDLALFSWSL